MESDGASLESTDYIAWQISAERQKHEWMLLRRIIVRTRWRIALYGHAAFLLICSTLNALGVQCAEFISLGWWSLCFIGISLLLTEWVHVRMLPSTPPRFVVRRSGLTEYSEEGPRKHWDWARTAQLSIETDCERPGYRSLVVGMKSGSALFEKFCRFSIPLPATDGESTIDERAIVEAVSRALEENRIRWQPRPDGAIALEKSA